MKPISLWIKHILRAFFFIRKSLMKRTQVLLFSASISNKTIKQANTITYNPVIYELSKENKELIPKNNKTYIYNIRPS